QAAPEIVLLREAREEGEVARLPALARIAGLREPEVLLEPPPPLVLLREEERGHRLPARKVGGARAGQSRKPRERSHRGIRVHAFSGPGEERSQFRAALFRDGSARRFQR